VRNTRVNLSASGSPTVICFQGRRNGPSRPPLPLVLCMYIYMCIARYYTCIFLHIEVRHTCIYLRRVLQIIFLFSEPPKRTLSLPALPRSKYICIDRYCTYIHTYIYVRSTCIYASGSHKFLFSTPPNRPLSLPPLLSLSLSLSIYIYRKI